MEDTIFFKPKGPFSLNKLIEACNYNDKIHDIKILDKANEKDITFFDSSRYSEHSYQDGKLS